MKPQKMTILVMLLGLLLLAFAAGMAQPRSQGDQKPKADACCCSGDAAKTDCCKGDSCQMKKKDKNHTDDHECCGCCADSCEMDMKDHKAECCKAKAKGAEDKNKQ